jgi:hypothetical protein
MRYRSPFPWAWKSEILLDLILSKDETPNIILKKIYEKRGRYEYNRNLNSSYDPSTEELITWEAKDNFIHYLRYIKEAKSIMEWKLRHKVLKYKVWLLLNNVFSWIK